MYQGQNEHNKSGMWRQGGPPSLEHCFSFHGSQHLLMAENSCSYETKVSVPFGISQPFGQSGIWSLLGSYSAFQELCPKPRAIFLSAPSTSCRLIQARVVASDLLASPSFHPPPSGPSGREDASPSFVICSFILPTLWLNLWTLALGL